MAEITPEQARAYFNRWALVSEVEAAELRQASIETKFRQLVALMESRHLFAQDPEREAQVEQVRETWARLRMALGG